MLIAAPLLRKGRRLLPALDHDLPTVTVQLPVYREENVLLRLLTAVVAMDYPSDLLSVQVLDDSDGESAEESRRITASFAGGPVSVEYLHRDNRHGYKAGALNYGTTRTKAELLAVFDADYVPVPAFLRKIVPYFKDLKVGAVQARWSYRNDLSSPLTALQAAILDTMFYFELGIRHGLGRPGIFLGTGGLWRRKTIEEVGGWKEFPFTSEDIDLTYRSHLAGWFIAFEEEPLSISEVPDTYLSYKAQQRRWARGVFRTLLDHWRPIFGSGNYKPGILEPSLFLLQLSTPMLVLLVPLLTLYVGLGLPRNMIWIGGQLALGILTLLSPTALQLLVSQWAYGTNVLQRLRLVARGVPLGIGLSISLLAGFADTLFSPKREFVRTAKQGGAAVLARSTRRWLGSAVRISIWELVWGGLSLATLVLALRRGYYETCVPAAALAMAFITAGAHSTREILQRLRAG